MNKFQLFFCKGKILEVGCGQGNIIELLKDKDIEATEIDLERLHFARKRFPSINIYNKDIFKEKFGKYDTILLLGVLEA